MARFQHTESTFSAAIRGALTGFVVAAIATVGLATASDGTLGGTMVELRVDASAEVAAVTPTIPFLHSAPVRPAA